MSNRLVQLDVYHLHLPFRGSFRHATAEREGTDTIVAAALLADGTVGYGEGVPRSYVTGETVESVLYNINYTLADYLKEVEPKRYAELLDLAESLPFTNAQGQIINTARCCVELALLDAYGKYFGCPASSLGGWLGHGSFTEGGSLSQIRVSGILDGSRSKRLVRRLRMMRWFGLVDFKLKMGLPEDEENLETVYQYLKNPLLGDKVSLRVDANGGWDVDTALGMCETLDQHQVCCLEQPLAADDRSHLFTMAEMSPIALMVDESLVSLEDGRMLAENDLVDYFNIRISKNGGLIASVRLAEIAMRFGVGYQLGAMVGESGILAAAGRQFLQLVPNISFTEICYSTFLLREEIVRENMRFGYGGKLKPLSQKGLGIQVQREKISKYNAAHPRQIHLA